MLGVILAIAFVCDSQPSPDPATLVNELGSSQYSQRISAESELARLGRMALPALRAAKHSKDAEIRARSTALLSRIENTLLLQATSVELDFRDLNLINAVEAIQHRTGLGLAFSAEERTLLSSRRITLNSNEPVPFWKAIDALCSAGSLHAVEDNQPVTGGLKGSILLLDGVVAGSSPVSDSGPFRVRLCSIQYQSEIQFGQLRIPPASQVVQGDTNPDGQPKPTQPVREFFLQFVVTAEPRLSINRNGAIKLTTAVDDRGHSLCVPSGRGNFEHTAGYFGMNPSSSLRLRVDLSYFVPAGKLIKTLRGSIPLVVAVRKPSPLVIPLAESHGKLFRSENMTLILLDHRPAVDHQPTTIQISLKSFGEPKQPANPGAGHFLGYQADSLQQQIEILDAQGLVIPWFPSGTSYIGDETRITITLAARRTLSEPVSIRFHEILRTKSDVPFEFLDIPIP